MLYVSHLEQQQAGLLNPDQHPPHTVKNVYVNLLATRVASRTVNYNKIYLQ